MRLWFWFLMMDFFNWIDWRRGYLFAVGKAGDATDWGEGADAEEEAPF